MKTFIAMLVAVLLTSIVIPDADARSRLGGGRSVGMQRESVKPGATAAPKPATPAQASPTTAAPASPSPVTAPPVPQPSGMSRWLGPLAGFATGGLLASMFAGSGFGGAGGGIMGLILMVAMLAGGFMLIRALMSRNAAQPAGAVGNVGTAPYAGTGYSPASSAPSAPSQPAAATGRMVAPEIGSGLASGQASVAEIEAATANPRIPADFDLPPFERQARAAFIRLQAANDAADLNDIRDFTTPEMFAEIALQIQERKPDAPAPRTDVVSLAVQVLEVVQEDQRAIASVRYSGAIREVGDTEPQPFDEVWNVTKNLADPHSTWRLAGIQQLA